MMDSLSEFLASRSRQNRLARYSEIEDEEEEDRLVIFPSAKPTVQRQQQPAASGLLGLAEEARPRQQFQVAKRRDLSRCVQSNRLDAQTTVKKFPQNLYGNGDSKTRCKRKSSVAALLSALLSSSSRRRVGAREVAPTRTQLVATLLKLPAVLGAMFSLSLVATLLVLYALNFHHCEPARQVDKLQTGWAQEKNATHQRHHINSRHLSGPAEETNLIDRQHKQPAGQTPIIGGHLRTAQVQTECGAHLGLQEEADSFAFRAIAYASPPTGSRRWKRPRPVWLDQELCPQKGASSSSGSSGETAVSEAPMRQTGEIGYTARQHCLQLSPFGQQKQLTGSEDCLYLDIFVPSNALANSSDPSQTKLPVMVYIHGGFLAFGSNGGIQPDNLGQANWMNARPSGKLASELSVVLVAPNFRLQALGFMALDQLGPTNRGPARKQSTSSGANYGLWDQLVALQWVSRNIGQFGGDRNNVVLFGPDSASALPLALLGNPKQARPFHAVWLTNPTIFLDLPHELAKQHYERLIKSQSICSNLVAHETNSNSTSLDQCLMGLSGEQIVREYLGKDDASYRLDDQNSLPIRNIFPDQFVDVDGQLVDWSFPFVGASESAPNSSNTTTTTTPGQTQTEPVAPLRLMIGSSAEAVEYWPCPRNLHAWTWEDFRRYVGASLNSFSAETYSKACGAYGVPPVANQTPTNSHTNAVSVYLKMVSDIKQICPINELVSALKKSRSPTLNISRYIVEQRASQKLAKRLSRTKNTDTNFASEQDPAKFGSTSGKKLAHSFHYFDLMAFFGYEHDVPNATDIEIQDLQFQREIRHVIKNFAWRIGLPTDGFTLFKEGGTKHINTTDSYRHTECSMWAELLGGQPYAWTS